MRESAVMRAILTTSLNILLTGFVLTGFAQTNRSPVYVTNYVTAAPSFRRVNGQLYNVGKSVLWINVKGECVHVATNGIVVQQYKTERHTTYAPVPGRYNAWGERINQRQMVTSDTATKIPTKKLFLKNFPDMRTVAVGSEISLYAMQVDPVGVQAERLECWDCGTPNVVPVTTVRTNR